MNAVDTNILFYAHDPRDAEKQTAAIELIETLSDGVLLWQVACEFLAACRKLEPLGYSRHQAWEDIRDLRLIWTTILPDWDVLERANSLLSNYSLSYWDAMIIAASIEGGVEKLFTEDYDAYPTIEGLEVVNPFNSAT